MARSLPDFSYESKLWGKYEFVAGMDEVGRGCFAGPVVAAAVALPKNINVKTQMLNGVVINDSKKLSSKQRELADKWIKENCLFCGIGKASVTEINRVGIKKATEIAFRRATKNCGKRIDYLLVDAFYAPYIRGVGKGNQLPIIGGDGKSISIAAASIIAKVYRDNLMTKLSQSRNYKRYKWHQNMGYGTTDHREAIKKHGTTPHHRKLFVRNLTD